MSDHVSYPTPTQWGPLLERLPEFAWSGPAAPIDLNADRHADLCRVHEEVRDRCPYKIDFLRHGKLDWWQPADAEGGDCEDQALARWQALHALGWPAECLSLCLCEGGAGHHAVLLVLCDGGLVALDNCMWMPAGLPDLTADIGGASGYRWLARSHGAGWVSMTEGRGLEETLALHPDIRVMNRRWSQARYAAQA